MMNEEDVERARRLIEKWEGSMDDVVLMQVRVTTPDDLDRDKWRMVHVSGKRRDLLDGVAHESLVACLDIMDKEALGL